MSAGDRQVRALLDAYASALAGGVAPAVQAAVQEIVRASAGPAAGAVSTGLAALIASLPLEHVGHACLLAGALVERGADPGVPVPALLDRLDEALPLAGEFSAALEAAAGEGEVTDAIQSAVALRLPGAFAAAQGFEGLERGAVACLSRSKSARSVARARRGLLEKAVQCAASSYIASMLAVLDDEALLVIHPSARKGFRISMSGVADNFQLQVILAHLLIGSGHLPGRPPAPAVVATALGTGPQQASDHVAGWWDMLSADALDESLGVAADLFKADASFIIWGEGRPSDIPPFNGVRTLVLKPATYARFWPSQRLFDGLRAEVEVTSVLDWPAVMEAVRAAPDRGKPAAP